MADSKHNNNRCSFCGRLEDEVGILITGMNAYICDICANQAYMIAEEAMEGIKRNVNPKKLNLKKLPKPLEIKEFLDQYVIGQDDVSPYRYTTTTNACCKKTEEMMWKLKSPTSSWWEAPEPEKHCWHAP